MAVALRVPARIGVLQVRGGRTKGGRRRFSWLPWEVLDVWERRRVGYVGFVWSFVIFHLPIHNIKFVLIKLLQLSFITHDL